MDEEISSLWWVALGVTMTALAFEGSRKFGAWGLILVTVSMLAYAREKGRI